MPSVLESLTAYAENPSAFLALNTGTRCFEMPGVDGLIAYRPSGRRYLIQLGGPFTGPGSYDPLLSGFLAFARQQRRRVVAIQLQRDDAIAYAARGFVVNQVGASYVVDLDRFTLKGSSFMRLRNKISRANRAGLVVSEVSSSELPSLAGPLDAIDREWLRSKGRHTKELRFLVGERGGGYQHCRRLFVGSVGGQAVAYISYSPVYGRLRGMMHDLSRRSAAAPTGAMEAINASAIGVFRSEGVPYLHFGFTPFTGIDPVHDVPGSSRTVSWIVRMLAEHGERIYPARSQLSYKEKWGPHHVLPEYVAIYGRASVAAAWRLARTTNAI